MIVHTLHGSRAVLSDFARGVSRSGASGSDAGTSRCELVVGDLDVDLLCIGAALGQRRPHPADDTAAQPVETLRVEADAAGVSSAASSSRTRVTRAEMISRKQTPSGKTDPPDPREGCLTRRDHDVGMRRLT